MPRAGRLFVPLDCGYFDDDRVVELSDLAQLLDLRALCLMRRLLSDGRLTRRQLERIVPNGGDIGAMIGELVAAGLWTEHDGAFERRSWSAWNDSAADIATMSKGGIEGNHLRWHVKRRLTNPECPLCAAGVIGGESGGDIPPDRGGNRRGEEIRGDQRRAGDLAPTTRAPAATPARPRDPLFDTLAEVCGIDASELTPSARGAMNRALADLRRVGAEPEDVHARANAYQRRWANVALTPTALARHWAELNPQTTAPTDAVGRAFEIARRAGR